MLSPFAHDTRAHNKSKREERILVAKEAARLLYYRFAEDYKTAKETASEILGIKSLPSNIEIAFELDKIADEIEASSRKDLIESLRREALKIMNNLKPFNPKLTGSVWRGTARKGSDIDIDVYSQDTKMVLDLIKSKYNVVRIEQPYKTEKGETKRFFHIFIDIPSGYQIEVIARSLEDMNEKHICDIFGDLITGLTISQLQEVLEKNPLQKFIPKLRHK